MAPAGRALGWETTEATELGCGPAQVAGQGLTPPPGSLFQLLVPKHALCWVQSHELLLSWVMASFLLSWLCTDTQTGGQGSQPWEERLICLRGWAQQQRWASMPYGCHLGTALGLSWECPAERGLVPVTEGADAGAPLGWGSDGRTDSSSLRPIPFTPSPLP